MIITVDTWQEFLTGGLTKEYYRHDPKYFSEKQVLIPFQYINKWMSEASSLHNFDTIYCRLEKNVSLGIGVIILSNIIS